MREIVHLQVGQFGNQIGTAFWEDVAHEHGINSVGMHKSSDEGITRKERESKEKEYDLQLRMHDVYFEEANNKYTPRAIMADFDPFFIDQCRSSAIGSLFNPNCFISGKGGTGLNWAKGYYTQGRDHIEAVLDLAQKAIEKCDSFQGFQLVHSLGGGCGSGFGSLICTKLRELYPDKPQSNFFYLPLVRRQGCVVIEPYNTILALAHLLETSDLMMFFEEPAMYDIGSRVLSSSHVPQESINRFMGSVMADITSSFRFPGHFNCDFNKLAANLVPFPRMKSLIPSYAPLYKYQGADYRAVTPTEMIEQLFSEKNILCSVQPRQGRCLTAAALFRGRLDVDFIDRYTENMMQLKHLRCVEWIPNHIVTALCPVPGKLSPFNSSLRPTPTSRPLPDPSSPPSSLIGPPSPNSLPLSAASLLNSSAIVGVYKRVSGQVATLLRRHSCMHYYLNEGMDELEFTEAESILNDILCEYEMADYTAGIDDVEEYADDEEL